MNNDKAPRFHAVSALAAVTCLCCIMSAVLTGTAVPAGATTCQATQTPLHIGQAYPTGWKGVEGRISTDSLSLPPDGSEANHILNWLGLEHLDQNPICGKKTGSDPRTYTCWLQIGNGIGNVGGQVTTTIDAYEENQDINGYHSHWYTTFGIPQNPFYTVFDSNVTDGFGDKELRAYIVTGSTPILIGGAWIPGNRITNMRPEVYTEIQMTDPTSCPVVSQSENFGTTGYGGYTISDALYLSPNGTTWYDWSGLPIQSDHSPYVYNVIHQYDAFSTYGS